MKEGDVFINRHISFLCLLSNTLFVLHNLSLQRCVCLSVFIVTLLIFLLCIQQVVHRHRTSMIEITIESKVLLLTYLSVYK